MATLGNTPRPAYVYDTETDTWVPIGVGAHTHDDLYINQTVIDAKGDLLVGTADNSYARLAKGADGTVLVADNTTQTGLAWQPYAAQVVAGKNAVINGGFDNWQRASSFTNLHGYTADRWLATGATAVANQVISRQTLTPGDLSGTGLKHFLRHAVSGLNGATQISLQHRIENVETFSGQTVTLSFYAKADSARNITAVLSQHFGSGGSADAGGLQNIISLNTAWARYSITGNLQSITGKTVGASSFVYLAIVMPLSTFTIDITGVQIEAGPVATPFSRAGGTIQGELAACQRYYYKIGPSDGSSSSFLYSPLGMANATTQVIVTFPFPQIMRVKPTSIEYTNPRVSDGANVSTATSLVLGDASSSLGSVNVNGSGFTVFRNYWMMNNSNSSLAFNAEL
jgi:hypothetical protein